MYWGPDIQYHKRYVNLLEPFPVWRTAYLLVKDNFRESKNKNLGGPDTIQKADWYSGSESSLGEGSHFPRYSLAELLGAVSSMRALRSS
jgi:hypothetical protein